MRNVITLGEGAELKKLWQQHADASRKAQMILIYSGMNSKEFAQADANVGQLWKRIREIQGALGEPTLN